MFNFVIQIILTMVVQLALLFRLINGQYRLNNDRKFVNVYTPEDHDEVLNELLDDHDVNDVLPNQNHASTEIAVLHNDELSNVPFPPIGIVGLARYGYIFQNKEDERVYDMKFIEESKTANEIFLEVLFTNLSKDIDVTRFIRSDRLANDRNNFNEPRNPDTSNSVFIECPPKKNCII